MVFWSLPTFVSDHAQHGIPGLKADTPGGGSRARSLLGRWQWGVAWQFSLMDIRPHMLLSEVKISPGAAPTYLWMDRSDGALQTRRPCRCWRGACTAADCHCTSLARGRWAFRRRTLPVALKLRPRGGRRDHGIMNLFASPATGGRTLGRLQAFFGRIKHWFSRRYRLR